jgi:hypothetical protein
MKKREWKEYDAAAEWQARRGLDGSVGSPLPDSLSEPVALAIAGDPESFADRVKSYATGWHCITCGDQLERGRECLKPTCQRNLERMRRRMAAT